MFWRYTDFRGNIFIYKILIQWWKMGMTWIDRSSEAHSMHRNDIAIMHSRVLARLLFTKCQVIYSLTNQHGIESCWRLVCTCALLDIISEHMDTSTCSCHRLQHVEHQMLIPREHLVSYSIHEFTGFFPLMVISIPMDLFIDFVIVMLDLFPMGGFLASIYQYNLISLCVLCFGQIYL